jgi:hypothetical protein
MLTIYVEDYIRSQDCQVAYGRLDEARKMLFKTQKAFQLDFDYYCTTLDKHLAMGDKVNHFHHQLAQVGSIYSMNCCWS